MKYKSVILFSIITLIPFSAKAERGWACMESYGGIQKYKIENSNMIPEGDPFTKTLEGTGYEPQKWHITVNNNNGIVSTLSDFSQSKKDTFQSGLFIDIITIEKNTGKYRHVIISGNSTKIVDHQSSCTDY